MPTLDSPVCLSLVEPAASPCRWRVPLRAPCRWWVLEQAPRHWTVLLVCCGSWRETGDTTCSDAPTRLHGREAGLSHRRRGRAAGGRSRHAGWRWIVGILETKKIMTLTFRTLLFHRCNEAQAPRREGIDGLCEPSPGQVAHATPATRQRKRVLETDPECKACTNQGRTVTARTYVYFHASYHHWDGLERGGGEAADNSPHGGLARIWRTPSREPQATGFEDHVLCERPKHISVTSGRVVCVFVTSRCLFLTPCSISF